MGGVLAHLVCILLLQDVNLFWGVTLARHLLYDKSATGCLTMTSMDADLSMRSEEHTSELQSQ